MLAKVVIIGSGAREHALVRAFVRGARHGGEREVVCLPGNAGIAAEVRCVSCAVGTDALAEAALAEKPELVVVGPEVPLAEGLADRLTSAGIPVFGPSAAAAQIEASKAFSKDVMARAGVPTAAVAVFDDRAQAAAHAARAGPCVVKLDGLAAGKGVIVCDDSAQAVAAVKELWPGAGGPAHPTRRARLLIEERLTGAELSVIAICDGEDVIALPPARDHKRIFDGDDGPNTGGMGAVCSPADATPALVQEVVRRVLQPTLLELKRRGSPFRGALYAGLMLTPRGLFVLEFNCRLGDPETQAILLRLDSDPLPLFLSAATGRLRAEGFLDTRRPVFDTRVAVAVVLASANYPAAPRTGEVIAGLDALAFGQPGGQGEELWVLHAGTRRRGGAFVTNGGRVLTVAALGTDLQAARAHAYAAAARISWPGLQLRTDIGLSRGSC